MQLCYVDESGTAETLVRTASQQQPVIVIAGVSLPERNLTIEHGHGCGRWRPNRFIFANMRVRYVGDVV